MKKIMLISPKDNNFYNFRSELIIKLKELENDVILVCPYGNKIDFFIEYGCRFIDVNIDRRGTSIFNDLKLMKSYNKILKDEHPDIVLTYTTKCSVYSSMICRHQKVPYLVNNAGLIDNGNHKSILARFLDFLYVCAFKGSSCMMYQNSKERDYINRLLKNKVHYRDIPGSGVNLDKFVYTDYPENDDIITFNYVARIVDIKGINEFLDCAKRVRAKYSNTRFVIYGDYDDDNYHKIIEEYIKNGIVEYGGILLDMKSAITSAHAVIHPSYYEGMTNVVLEHSAMGRPSIGSDIPGVAEGIENGITGYTFESRNSDLLTEAVCKFILLSHDEKVKMGKLARTKMEKQFDRNIVTNIYIEEIEKTLSEEI
ncbi:MAG: glycosyltransferase family 4 protein [Anaerovoracaceae bacterium]